MAAVVVEPAARRTHVYEPAAARPSPTAYLRDIWRRRSLAVELSSSEIRSQHLDTLFGRLWLVLHPLLLAAVYLLLIDILRGGSHPPGILAHLLAGMFAYQLASDGMRRGIRSLVESRGLILNFAFPRILLPLAGVLTAFRRFAPCVAIYVPVHLLCDRPVGLALLWLLPLTVLLVAFTAGAACVLAAAQVYFRDLRELLPFVLRVGLFVSPILYLPSEARAYSLVLDLNPVGQTLTAWSDVLYRGVAPSTESLLLSGAWAAVALAAGVSLFAARERDFATRL